MKLLAPALLVGAVSAALLQEQHVLKPLEDVARMPEKTWAAIQEKLKSVPEDAKALWEETAKMFPEEIAKLELFSKPKSHNRRPDKHWDHIVRGADVQNLWTENSSGQKERQIDGKLDTYDLRVKKVDPSKLGIDPGVKQYSGYLDDKENDKHLFYWFFESRNDPKNDPVVLWLNGGPGCSSLTGLFMELGPASIDKKLNIVHNKFAWNNNASVIFLDQPVNVGYSYSSGQVSDTVAAGKDIYALLSLFFKQFPEYADQSFHIAGESYAGHYIPVFTAEILSHKNTNINLKSALIGNGLTDGVTQYAYYRPMACGDGGWPAVLDPGECTAMDNAYPRCASLIESCYNSESVWNCVPASIYCNNALIGPYQRTGQNVYDVRSKCEDSSNLCYSALGYISDYLNRKDVIEALGVEVSSYESCNFDINRNFLFQGDWMKPYHRLVPQVLDKIPVLIYAGDADYICNWLGNQAWTNALKWPGAGEFQKASVKNLTLSSATAKLAGDKSLKGKHIGEVKSAGNFTFMRLFAGGHMVPMDQPEASLDMLNRWLDGEWIEK